MPKPCSLELRERVVEAIASGASRREAAEWFAVSPSSAIKWMQRQQETGSIAPKPSGGSISPLEAHADFLLVLIADRPDLTLDEIVAAMRKRRIAGSRSAVWRFFERHSISFKKSLQAAEQKRADVARARRRWMREQGMFDPARLVFIDETSTNTAMVRLRGRCPRGIRLIDHVPHGALEDDHLHRRPTPSRDGCALLAGWTHEYNILHGLSQTMSHSHSQARRHRDDG